MKTALFTNWTEQEFTGYWNGKGKTFQPGQTVPMPDYLAAHFAKHLTNRELLRTDANGNLVHKDGDKMTSPKHPEQVPLFMELYNKAFQYDDIEILGDKKDDIDTLIQVAAKTRGKNSSLPTSVPEDKLTEHVQPSDQDPTQPQIVLPPEGDEDEDNFEGKPQE